MRNNQSKNDRLDEIMKMALASEMKPEEELNRNIIQQWKEQPDMRKWKARKIHAAAAAAACLLLVTVTAGAAVRYLNSKEIAERAESKEVAAAFEGQDAIEINEVKEAGGYRFTLIGITKGSALVESALSEVIPDLEGTYATIAIERLDGAPMPSTSEDAYGDLSFFISPLIEGLAPWQYNIASMNGSYADFEEKGVLYRLISCDDIEKFADHKIHLCIIDSPFYDTNAYHYEESTGEITRREEYNGINLLFDLPIDTAKANPVEAEKYLKELEASWSSDDADGESAGIISDDMEQQITNMIDEIINGNEDKALEGAVLLEDQTKTVTESDGSYQYEFSTEGQTSIIYFYKANFKNGKDVQISYTDFDESTEQYQGIFIAILTEKEDNTAEIRTYQKTL